MLGLLAMQKYHVSVAAEAYAAAAFARAGYEVSVQYGANQPGYDLVAIKGQRRLLISVEGSQDGGWVLHGKFKENRNWSEAVEKWRGAQSADTIMFFVQFRAKEFSCDARNVSTSRTGSGRSFAAGTSRQRARRCIRLSDGELSVFAGRSTGTHRHFVHSISEGEPFHVRAFLLCAESKGENSTNHQRLSWLDEIGCEQFQERDGTLPGLQ
jgi:hypothetical protein